MNSEVNWNIISSLSDQDSPGKQESLFSLANGYLGFRGFYPERQPVFHAGVFVNGFYDTEPIVYGEKAYGFAEYNQSMLDLPDARSLQVLVDGQVVAVDTGKIIDHRMSLDLKEGVLHRYLEWESPEGSRVRISWEFLVSYTRRQVASMRLTVEPITCSSIKVISSIAPSSGRMVDYNDPRVRAAHQHINVTRIDSDNSGSGELTGRFATVRSGQVLYCGAVHTDISGDQVVDMRIQGDRPQIMVLDHEGSDTLKLTKHMVYVSDQITEEQEIGRTFRDLMKDLRSLCFEQLCREQADVLADFWKRSHLSIPSDEHLELALRFNMFQIFQSAGRDGRTGLAAKGLTGSGYEGHNFWDTEIYGLPFFIFTRPEIARSLLSYRISLMPKARIRSQQLDGRGILFPWRTINGDEASAYFPAGTAQYHINADIVYALMLYLTVTGDRSIMADGGAELLFETARFYADLGFFSERRGGEFCIHEVTGPDEYSALVNNNLYTNLMAQFNLQEAFRVHDSGEYKEVSERLHILPEEAETWKRAADLMYLPFDEELALHPQDDQFLERERWDFEHCPKDRYPLLLHFHPLVIYRHQVIKQADVVLAHLLRSQAFPWYEKRRDYFYYESLTTGDSSLSACIQGIMALEVGDTETGVSYLRKTALMDLDDYQKNVKDGLHTAAMAGSWLALVYGMAGMRMVDGIPRFNPIVHRKLNEYLFTVGVRGALLEVSIDERYAQYRLCSGERIELTHYGKRLILSEDQPVIKLSLMPALQAVIFDLDGVITSTDEQHFLAWKRLSDELGMQFDRELNHQLRGVSRTESLEIIAGHNGREFSQGELDEYTDRKNGYYRDLLQSLTADALLPGALELCRQLRENKILIGIASASRNAPFILEKLGLNELIDTVAPAGEVKAGKPDPEVFVRCADQLGVPRAACVGFEDAHVGIQAIQHAGMKCVAVGEGLKGVDSDLYIDDLSQVNLKRLKELFPSSGKRT
jgi:alpha,alpha-trehalose phosphorylase